MVRLTVLFLLPFIGCTTFLARDFEHNEIRHIVLMTDVLCDYFGAGDTSAVDLSSNLNIGKSLADSMRGLLMEKGYVSITVLPPTVGSRTAKALHRYDPWHIGDSVFHIVRAPDGKDTLYTKVVPLHTPSGVPTDTVPPYALDALVRSLRSLHTDDNPAPEDGRSAEGNNVLVYLCAYGHDRPTPSFLEELAAPYVRIFTLEFVDTDEVLAALSIHIIDLENGRVLYSDRPEPFWMKPTKDEFLDRLHQIVRDLPERNMNLGHVEQDAP